MLLSWPLACTASHRLTGQQVFGSAGRGEDMLSMVAVVPTSDSDFVFSALRLGLRSTVSRCARGQHVIVDVDSANQFERFTGVCQCTRRHSRLGPHSLLQFHILSDNVVRRISSNLA
jgi:hypothetical protein